MSVSSAKSRPSVTSAQSKGRSSKRESILEVRSPDKEKLYMLIEYLGKVIWLPWKPNIFV